MNEARPQTPMEVLNLLLDGNKRFVEGDRLHPHQNADHRTSLAPAQHPFAVVFGCADSRLAAEIIFDRGLGDLFVVRTAGHVVGSEVLGSIEYGVEILGAPLIVVLGHDSCGAIAAALNTANGSVMPTGFMRDVVERVLLSVFNSPEALIDPDVASAEHVRYTVNLLSERSPVIARRLANGSCAVVGLTYQLAEGTVHPVASRGLTLTES